MKYSSEQATITVDEETVQAEVTFTDESSVERISFTDDDVEGEVTIAEYEAEPEETGASPGGTISVVQIEVPEPDRSATVTTRVSTERIDEIGADPDDLGINRFADGEWQRLDSDVVAAEDEFVVLSAETPGFSFFSVSAVAEPSAALSITPEEVDVGEQITLDASASEERYGEIVAYAWRIAGETSDGETHTVRLDEPGTYTVELTVTNDAGETDTTTADVVVTDPSIDDPAPTPEPDDADLTLVLIGVLAIVVLAVAALVAYRYRIQDGR